MRTSDGESLAATEATTHDEVWRGARLARWGCALLATLVIGLDIAGIPATYAQQSVVAAPGAAIYAGALTPAQAHMLTTLGLSLGQYAAIQVAEAALLELVFFVVALTLLWRKPASRMALFAACALVLFGASFGQATGGGMMGALAVRSDAWKFIVTLIGFLGDVTFPVLFYLFPSGRWVPHWSRWLVFPWIAVEGFQDFAPNSPLGQQSLLGSALFIGLVSTTIASQIYRYRRVSTPIERQQTKWVVFGFAIGIGGFLTITTIGGIVATDLTSIYPLTLLLVNASINLCMALVPLSIGIAILRSRLFDIDIIVNRALVYGALTATLAAVYFGIVIGLQQLVRLLSGQSTQPAWVIVLSTLVIAALFQPLRRWLQATIDRRFYRSRYDSARTLERFAASLRSEVDLAQLNEQLLLTVDDAMRPMRLSLWLRPQPRRHDGDRARAP